jgi:hypothetical protein
MAADSLGGGVLVGSCRKLASHLAASDFVVQLG